MKKVIIMVVIMLTATASVYAAQKKEVVSDMEKSENKKAITSSGGGSSDADAERLWKSNCSPCHGTDGKGHTAMGAKMGISDFTTGNWQNNISDAKIKDTIRNGLKRDKNGIKQEMAAFKGKLTPEQINNLLPVIRSLGR